MTLALVGSCLPAQVLACTLKSKTLMTRLSFQGCTALKEGSHSHPTRLVNTSSACTLTVQNGFQELNGEFIWTFMSVNKR